MRDLPTTLRSPFLDEELLRPVIDREAMPLSLESAFEWSGTLAEERQLASATPSDPLETLLAIPGRFDDPKRDAALEMDGTRFDVFLGGGDRQEFVTKWFEDHAALRDAAREKDAELLTTDIVKAWFVIHDVAAGSTLGDRRYQASQTETKKGSVHGYLNRNGFYAATHDFTKNRQATVFEFLSRKGRAIANGRTINIETVPDIEDVPVAGNGSYRPPSRPALYASIGYRRRVVQKEGEEPEKRVTYYKWTKTAFDVLADLYVFASARAAHLLTVTVHKEMDRNLARSVLWREYSAEEILAGKGKHWNDARNRPSKYHGDPPAFDVQAFYDLVTAKLNALGGKQMPAGARYGIHPLRVRKPDGLDVINGSTHLHEFPHQSNPKVSADKALKKDGWWKT